MGNLAGNALWHNHPSIRVDASVSASRNGGERDPYVQWYFGFYNQLGSYGTYLGSNSIGMRASADGVSNVDYCIGRNGSGWGDSTEIDFTAYNTNSPGSSNVSFDIWCHQGIYVYPTGEDNNCTAGSGTTTDYGQSTSPYNGSGSTTVKYTAYKSEIPPTNVSAGWLYNQNGVQNGNEKPDWNFYANWNSALPGTHSITQYNLDIYKNGDNNTKVAYIDNVSKNTIYNMESLLPKCKPGETYNFMINTLVDNSYLLGPVFIGSMTLYKDGIILIKDASGVQREATMVYFKPTTETFTNAPKVRYALVKDSSGVQRIIDVYTTHYE